MSRKRFLGNVVVLGLAAALAGIPCRAAIDTLLIGPDCVPDMAVATAFSITFTISGGTPPYTLGATGALPPGMTLSGLTLSGTPTAAGISTLTLTATDAAGDSGSRTYELRVMESWNIVLGSGAAWTNPNEVRVFAADGTSTPVDFLAYSAGQYGVYVAAGNVAHGPGATMTSDEIVTGPGPGAVFGPHVRGWYRDGSSMTKLSYYAYGTLRFGVNVAAGDVEGDRWDEVVTGAGAGDVFGPHVRGWNYDNAGISAMARINFFAYATLRFGVNVAAGDIDGDCMDEILTGPGPSPSFAGTVRGFNYDGIAVSAIAKASFNAFDYGYGVVLAAGDVDADHMDEIVATPGPGPLNPAIFVGFDYDGTGIGALPGYTVTPFATMYGGRVGLAGVGDPPGAIVGGLELLAAPGPDPTADSSIAIYAYTGSALLPVGSPGTIGLPGQFHGVNPAGARLGY